MNGIRIETGDFRVLSEQLSDDSVDLVLTDPPYNREFLYLYDDLKKIFYKNYSECLFGSFLLKVFISLCHNIRLFLGSEYPCFRHVFISLCQYGHIHLY